MHDVVISIVNYHQPELLERCLGQLETLTLPDSWATIVVDNESGDDAAAWIRDRYSWVRLIVAKENLGFGGGHNLAYAQSDSRLFFVLNPDVIVLPDSLETLVSTFAKYPKAAVIGPQLLNPDRTPQYSARRFYDWRTVLARRLPLPGHRRIHSNHLMKDCDLSKTQPVDWLLGAAMGIRRAAFGAERLFDPRYKLYFEDVDLCYFAQKVGWQVLFCPEAVMIHDHQRASAKKLFGSVGRQHFASWLKFYWKAKTYCQDGQGLPLRLDGPCNRPDKRPSRL